MDLSPRRSSLSVRRLDRPVSAVILSAEEENELIEAARDANSTETLRHVAQERLILAFMPMLRGVARRFGSVSEQEATAAAMEGFYEAILKFEPAQGNRLATIGRIKAQAAVSEFALRAASNVALTQKQRRNVKNILTSKRRKDARGLSDIAGMRATAEELGMLPTDVEYVLNRGRTDVSFETTSSEDGDGLSYSELMSDGSDLERDLLDREENEARRTRLIDALDELDDRRRFAVMAKLREPPMAREAVAEALGISPQRVSQLTIEAQEKLRAILSEKEAKPDTSTSTGDEVVYRQNGLSRRR